MKEVMVLKLNSMSAAFFEAFWNKIGYFNKAILKPDYGHILEIQLGSSNRFCTVDTRSSPVNPRNGNNYLCY